jgi:O-antigen/teichoic acid export membrane protein
VCIEKIKWLKLNRFTKSSYFKGALLLTSGTAVAQLISIFTTPIITRIYTSSDYGLLGVFMMVTQIANGFATLQYQNVIVIDKDEENAKTAMELIILIAIVVSCLFLILILILKRVISSAFNNPELGGWMFLIPFSVLINGLSIAFISWANRMKDFKIIARNRIISVSIIAFTSILLGLIFKGPSGLIIANVFGQIIAAILLIYTLRIRYKLCFTFQIDRILKVFRKNINYLKFSFPSDFINIFINQIPIIMLGKYSGTSTIGQFNLSNSMLGKPISLISSSVFEVFRQRASNDYNKFGRCDGIFIKTFFTLFIFSIIPFAIIFFLGPDLFKIIFGSEWEMAGTFSKIMAPMFFLRFTITPLTYTFLIANKQKEDFWGHIGMLTIVFCSFPLSYHIASNELSLLLGFSLSYCLVYIYYLIRSYFFSKGNRTK